MALSPSDRRPAEIGFAALLVAAAGAAYAAAGSYPGAAGLWPRVLSVALAALSVGVILRALARGPAAAEAPGLFDHPGRALLGFATLGAYVLGIDWLGYTLASLVFGIGLPLLLGYRDWRLLLPVVIGTLAFILLVFRFLLERPLPPDLLLGLFGVR